MGLKYVDPNDLDRLTQADGYPLPADYDQHTVIAQVRARCSTTSRPASTSWSR